MSAHGSKSGGKQGSRPPPLVPVSLAPGSSVYNVPFAAIQCIASEPVLSLPVERLAVEEHVLVLTLHHIVCDGWSMGLLARELCLKRAHAAHPDTGKAAS